MLENHLTKRQANGVVVKHHKTLPRADLFQLLDHAIYDPKFAVEYDYRYIISFRIALGGRPTAMWELKMSHFRKTTVDGKEAYIQGIPKVPDTF